MVSRLDLKHMRVFLSVVREKNASKVADDVGLSQQAVSAYLKKLRDEFQQELFIRQSNGLQPTDFAYELAAKFERVLQEFNNIFDTTPFNPASLNRTVRLIANEYSQLTLIPRLVSNARANAPGIKFDIIDFDARTHAEQLASGSVDLVIAFADHIEQGLQRKFIRNDRYTCVVRRASRIAREIRTIRDLSKFPHVTFANGATQFGDTVDDFLAKNNVSRDVVSVLSCYTSLHAFISCNDVIAFVPSAIASAGNFKTLDIDLIPQSFDVVVGWHQRATDNPLREWLVDLIGEL